MWCGDTVLHILYTKVIVIGSVYPEVWRLKNCKEIRQVRLTKVITIQG